MTCEPIPGGGFVCSRGSRRPKCSTPGCGGRGDYQCDFALGGKAVGETCNRFLCAQCRVPQGGGRDYCRAHNEFARKSQ